MADHAFAPDEICAAVKNGELATVREWLDTGGDANARCPRDFIHLIPLESLLQRAAGRGNAEIISLLLSRGADVDATDSEGRTALYHCIKYARQQKRIDSIVLLLARGADPNLARDYSCGGPLAGASPTTLATADHFATDSDGLEILRLLLRAGADLEHRTGEFKHTAEAHARRNRRSMITRFLRDVRLAGGWVRYALQPHYDLLVFRALCHRGRATFDSWTPEVLVRLFGAPEARRRNNAVRGRTDLPDPLFWRVLEFSLGTPYDYPWVRQRVRARAAAVAAAE